MPLPPLSAAHYRLYSALDYPDQFSRLRSVPDHEGRERTKVVVQQINVHIPVLVFRLPPRQNLKVLLRFLGATFCDQISNQCEPDIRQVGGERWAMEADGQQAAGGTTERAAL